MHLPNLPNGPRVPATPWFPIFYPLKKVKYDLPMVHLKWKDVQCLVLDFCDVKWDSGDIGWYWVTFWLITWYWQRLTLNDAAAEWHPMLNSDLEWFWASEWHCPRGRCRCWHWVTMEGKQRRSQVQRLQHIYSAPLSHRHTHKHAHSKTQANTQTHTED